MYYNQFMTEYISQFISSDDSRFLSMNVGTGVLDMINNSLYLGVDPETIAELESQEIVTQQNEEVMETENIEIIEENPVTLEPLIPENSGTILMDEYTSRFNGAIWYNKVQQLSVILAGAGGIGSYVGFLLSRLKINNLKVYDPDIVEAVNMSGQFYPTSSIGEHKVTALAKLVKSFASFYNIQVYNELYTPSSPSGAIMICGFDNMLARRTFFNRWLDFVNSGLVPSEQCLFIDGRLAAEEFQVLSIQGNDERAIREYQSKWLFSDEEAEATVCSYKQTTFMANMIASVMVNVFVNFAANNSDPAPVIPRDIPFFISYSADTMFTKVEL